MALFLKHNAPKSMKNACAPLLSEAPEELRFSQGLIALILSPTVAGLAFRGAFAMSQNRPNFATEA